MATRLLSLLSVNGGKYFRRIHTSSKSFAFYELDRKEGYTPRSDFVKPKTSLYQKMCDGYRQLGEELVLFKEEVKENLRMDPKLIYEPGEIDIKYQFNGDPNSLNDWIVTADSDYEGKSKATLQLTPNGTALFSGTIDTTAVQDGTKRQSGYCNIRSVQPRKSFYRRTVHDWGIYTHLILRVRGDGRSYMLNLHVKTTFDVMWHDLHHFVMYTRGGPYFQYVKIPFSKFLFSNRGRIQDKQARVKTHEITALGITASDGISGPFSLEIDFVGCESDHTFYEEFAYEMYHAPHPFYI